VRQNEQCLKCKSLERHSLLACFLKEKTNLLQNKGALSFLYFAPERFFYNLFTGLPHIRYVGCDYFPNLYNYVGKAAVQFADITRLPFEDKRFDAIICVHVLEHIPDNKKTMQEILRVLKPGGWAVLQVPLDYSREKTYEDWSIVSEADREKAFGQKDHVRWYGRDYTHRLQATEFRVKVLDIKATKEAALTVRYGFEHDTIIYQCSRPV
jgi:SAM-dependent methyltransferase